MNYMVNYYSFLMLGYLNVIMLCRIIRRYFWFLKVYVKMFKNNKKKYVKKLIFSNCVIY